MATKEILGKTIDLDADGYLADQGQWDEAIAAELAKEVEIPELTDEELRLRRKSL